MPDYIDRDAVYHAISVDGGLNAYEKAYCIDVVRKITAADVSHVRHGKWIKRKSWDSHVCSECSFEARPLNYCPNCGAKMDGGNKNDE